MADHYMTIETFDSSSSSPTPTYNYDVFISFRGEDTHTNITAHLFQKSHDENIQAYRDDTNLKRGEEIGPELLNAIETSRIAVMAFSKNYATSSWCSDELVKIMECKRTLKQKVLLVFFHVSPSMVRTQEETFALSDGPEDKVERWRAAMTATANLSGYDVKLYTSESHFIMKIVHDIRKLINGETTTAATSQNPNHHRIDVVDELRRQTQKKMLYQIKQKVLPVFYNVNPSEVREQTGNFAQGLLIDGPQNKVNSWRNALREAANLAGEHLKPNCPEPDFINNIVETILENLPGESRTAPPRRQNDVPTREGSPPINRQNETASSINRQDELLSSIIQQNALRQNELASSIFGQYALRQNELASAIVGQHALRQNELASSVLNTFTWTRISSDHFKRFYIWYIAFTMITPTIIFVAVFANMNRSLPKWLSSTPPPTLGLHF